MYILYNLFYANLMKNIKAKYTVNIMSIMHIYKIIQKSTKIQRKVAFFDIVILKEEKIFYHKMLKLPIKGNPREKGIVRPIPRINNPIKI